MDLGLWLTGHSGERSVQKSGIPQTGWGLGWRAYASILAIVATGMAVTIAETRVALQSQHERAVHESRDHAATLATAFTKTLQSATEVIYGLAAYFASSQEVDRDEFHTFAETALADRSAIIALEYAPRVLGSDRNSWEAEACAQGFPGFQVTEEDSAGTLIRAADRDEYFPVCYVEPLQGNGAALGYDLASEPLRRVALERARATGQSAVTVPVKQVGSQGCRWEILIFRGVFNRGKAKLEAPNKAPQQFNGCVVSVVDVVKLVESAFRGLDSEGIHVSLLDRMAPAATNLLPSGPTSTLQRSSGEVWSKTVEVAGHTYELEFSPTHEFLASRAEKQPWIVFLTGTLLTLLAGSRWMAALRHAARLESSERELAASLTAAELAQKETALLDSVTEKINSGLELEQILDYVYTSFGDIIPYDRMGFAMVHDSVVHGLWARTKSGPLKLPINFTAPLVGSSLEAVFKTGKPRIINDLIAYGAAHPQSAATPLILSEGVRSNLTCPLVANCRPVGFLFFSSYQPHTYQEAHVDRFMRVARQLSSIVDKARCYEEVLQARKRLTDLIDGLLPKGIPEQLRRGDGRVAEAFDQASVLFADLVGFSSWSSQMRPTALVQFLSGVFTEFDRLAQRFAVQKIGSLGDSYLAVAGVPEPNQHHAESIASLALSMRANLRKFTLPGGNPLSLRIGLHTGPVVAGIIGEQVYRYDVWGKTVNFASRMESSAEPGRIQISEQMFLRLNRRFRCVQRGLVEVKGFGSHLTFWLEEGVPASVYRGQSVKSVGFPAHPRWDKPNQW